MLVRRREAEARIRAGCSLLTVEGWWWTEFQTICRRVKVVRFRGEVHVVVETNKLRRQLGLLELSTSGLLNTQLAVDCGLIDVCVLDSSPKQRACFGGSKYYACGSRRCGGVGTRIREGGGG